MIYDEDNYDVDNDSNDDKNQVDTDDDDGNDDVNIKSFVASSSEVEWQMLL